MITLTTGAAIVAGGVPIVALSQLTAVERLLRFIRSAREILSDANKARLFTEKLQRIFDSVFDPQIESSAERFQAQERFLAAISEYIDDDRARGAILAAISSITADPETLDMLTDRIEDVDRLIDHLSTWIRAQGALTHVSPEDIASLRHYEVILTARELMHSNESARLGLSGTLDPIVALGGGSGAARDDSRVDSWRSGVRTFDDVTTGTGTGPAPVLPALRDEFTFEPVTTESGSLVCKFDHFARFCSQ